MSANQPTIARPPISGLVVTLIGLLVLLVVPILAWERADHYRSLVEEDVDPARHQIGAVIETGNEARSTAFYYLFTLDKTYEVRYRDLVSAWQKAASDESHVARCGPTVLWAWRAGRAKMADWFARYGDQYMRTGEQRSLPDADRLFQAGEAEFRNARTGTDKVASTLHDEAATVSRAEIAVTAAMAMICTLLAAFAWRDAQTRDLLWKREQDAVTRLQLAVTETNHRVKNNLQVIASLLDMKLMDHDGPVPREQLRDVVRQVRAVAAVHDFLSHEVKSDVVPGGPMLQRLAELTSTPTGVRTRVEAAAGTLNVKQATAVALIANELLLNASKHGATEARLRMEANGQSAHLRVADNGPGFPEGFDPDREANVGLVLVRTLAEHDLAGGVCFRNDHGAVVDVTFPLESAPESLWAPDSDAGAPGPAR